MTVDAIQLKAVIKEVVWELFQEKREEFLELLTEIIEDTGLANAIREGKASEPVKRDEVFAVLDAAP